MKNHARPERSFIPLSILHTVIIGAHRVNKYRQPWMYEVDVIGVGWVASFSLRVSLPS